MSALETLKRKPNVSAHLRKLAATAFAFAGILFSQIPAGFAANEHKATKDSQSKPGSSATPLSSKTIDKTANAAPIRIGFVCSLSGAAAQGGQDMVNGIRLYLNEIDNKIAGRKVDLIVENDESSQATGRARIKKLVEQDHVQMIAGFSLSNVAYAAAPIVEKYQIPTILTIAAADDLTKRKRSKWMIRTGWSGSQGTQPFGEWVYKNLHYKKIVTFGVDYSYGWEAIGGFQRTFEEAGGQVIQKIWAPFGFTDFRSFISKIDKGADAVFVLTANQSAKIFPKQYHDLGMKLPIIAGATSYDESVLQAVGDLADGVKSPSLYSAAIKTPQNKKFVSLYTTTYGTDPSHYSEGGYATGMWIKKTIEAVHGNLDDKEKVLIAMRKVQLPDAPRGPIKLDDYGNPIENVYLRKVEKINGKVQNTVIYTFPQVSQFWKYSPEEYMAEPPYSKDYPPCLHCLTH